LITGTNKRYRIYTTTDESLIEGRWDLDPIEFDTVDDERVKTYLIEFFWLLQIRMISSAVYLCFPSPPPVTVTNIELGPRIIVRGRQFLSSFFKLF
jgi:hypothetical protein